MHIRASSTISHQATFRTPGFSAALLELQQPSQLVAPDYTAFIPAMERRRMSEVLKMGIACSLDCLEQAGLEQPDAIIVGTSQGCPIHTKTFLDKISAADGGLISPTAFMLSTHNTIAGQISLLLKNHSYNMTHTQNSLSFEQALLDAMLCINDGSRDVLVGAADEIESELYNLEARLDIEDARLAFGASFFILSAETSDTKTIRLRDVASFGLISAIPDYILGFLMSNNLSARDIDLVLYSGTNNRTEDALSTVFNQTQLFDFQTMSGIYFTNSGFAMDYGIDILLQLKHPLFGENTNRILVCNNLIPENLGLILLDKNNN